MRRPELWICVLGFAKLYPTVGPFDP